MLIYKFEANKSFQIIDKQKFRRLSKDTLISSSEIWCLIKKIEIIYVFAVKLL